MPIPSLVPFWWLYIKFFDLSLYKYLLFYHVYCYHYCYCSIIFQNFYNIFKSGFIINFIYFKLLIFILLNPFTFFHKIYDYIIILYLNIFLKFFEAVTKKYFFIPKIISLSKICFQCTKKN